MTPPNSFHFALPMVFADVDDAEDRCLACLRVTPSGHAGTVDIGLVGVNDKSRQPSSHGNRFAVFSNSCVVANGCVRDTSARFGHFRKGESIVHSHGFNEIAGRCA